MLLEENRGNLIIFLKGGICVGGYGSDWCLMRNFCRQRDNNRCRRCGSDQEITVHHIIPRKVNGGSNQLENLIVLCHQCHEEFNMYHDIEIDDWGKIEEIVKEYIKKFIQFCPPDKKRVSKLIDTFLIRLNPNINRKEIEELCEEYV